jgi:hypothetical protein
MRLNPLDDAAYIGILKGLKLHSEMDMFLYLV